MDGKTFDRAAAKAAGYSEAEINAFLASSTESSPAPQTAQRRQLAVPTMAPAESTGTRRQTPTTLSERVQTAQRRENMQAIAERQGGAIPAFLANISRDIPGAEAAQAGVRSIARGQPYREALGDIRQATDALPTIARVAPRVAGAALAGAVMPGSTALRQGATYGALSGLSEASPDVGAGERVGRALGQAALGGAVAKGVQIGGTVARSAFTPSRADLLLNQAEATTRRAGPLYDQFKQLGTLPPTQQLDDILSLPVVRRALETVKNESPILRNLADTDARVLDAVYKRVGSRSFKAQHGFETGEARKELLDAIDQASGGLYRPAVRMFSVGSQQSSAIQRGARAAQVAATPTGGGSTMRSALEDSPEALQRWAQTATPAQRRAAVQGVLSGLGARTASDITRINLWQPLSWMPPVRRANMSANVIADIERTLPRTAVRRTADSFIPTLVTPRDRSIPE